MTCDWLELTDRHGGELIERTPTAPGDLLLADRNYLRPEGLYAVVDNGAHLLVRMRWKHMELFDSNGERFYALERARQQKFGEVGEYHVRHYRRGGTEIHGRVLITRVPAKEAEKAKQRLLKQAKKKGKTVAQNILDACHFVMLFTTIPSDVIGAADVLQLYRYRWQIELAFKRLKSLLGLDCLRHKEPQAARTWIVAKLLLALLLEAQRRQCDAFFPWGFDIRRVAQRQQSVQC